MKKLVLVFLFLLAANAFAQTKRIAHRSHSGSNTAFHLNSEGNFGEIGPNFSNFSKKQIDSMLRSDSVLRFWYDSIYRAEAASRAHAIQVPARNPKPGQGAAAGGAAASGIPQR